MREESTWWIKQASCDFKAAKDNLGCDNFSLVAFLCHETIEKGLKAILIERASRAPPKTHNLMRLARETRVPERFRPTVVFIASSYTLSRYPDVSSAVPFEHYTKQDAAKRIKMTEVFFSWIREQFQDL